MNMDVDKHSGYYILKPLGRVDHATCAKFNELLKPYLDECLPDGQAIILDFSDVNYISSVGLRVLMMAAKQVKTQQGRIVMAALSPVVDEVFTVSRFNLIYQIFDTVAAAVDGIGKPENLAGSAK